jgi:hypothetical protein
MVRPTAEFGMSPTASSGLTGKACSPNTIQWVNDVRATGNATARPWWGAARTLRGNRGHAVVDEHQSLGRNRWVWWRLRRSRRP